VDGTVCVNSIVEVVKVKVQEAFDHPGGQTGGENLAHEGIWQKRI